jgi:hypothetical protein
VGSASPLLDHVKDNQPSFTTLSTRSERGAVWLSPIKNGMTIKDKTISAELIKFPREGRFQFDAQSSLPQRCLFQTSLMIIAPHWNFILFILKGSRSSLVGLNTDWTY